jgi:hypothetical protein
MSEVIDMRTTVEPKSDQMNADDLIGGPRTIRITRVALLGGDQPVALYFEGDNGKPYKPCKSMRRVLIAGWGSDGATYAGRGLTLFRDEGVQFGGMQVGGIRLSHMTHIDKPLKLALTVTKAKRAPFVVQPLVIEDDKATIVARDLMTRVRSALEMAELEKITSDETVTKQRAWLKKNRPELAAQVDNAIADARAGMPDAGELPDEITTEAA